MLSILSSSSRKMALERGKGKNIYLGTMIFVVLEFIITIATLGIDIIKNIPKTKSSQDKICRTI